MEDQTLKSRSTCKQQRLSIFGSAAERMETETVHRDVSSGCDAAPRDRSMNGRLRASGQVLEEGSR